MKIIIAEDYEKMGAHAANIMGAQVIQKPNCVLGLATGSTPLSLYAELARRNKEGFLDFSQVKTVNLDEYVGLGMESDQSYVYFMRKNLFEHINIDIANTNLPNGLNADAEKECKRYDEVIQSLGGIDMQLLGIGHNGHIGFNEPAGSFSVNTQCVELQKSTIEANARFFAGEDEVPQKAYTMGVGVIMKARKILVIATGEDKANIVYEMIQGPVTPNVPASILQMHGDVTVVLDKAAASKLGA